MKGKMSEDVLAAMECVCDEGMLNEAVDVIRHPEKYLPVLCCPDCGSCPSAGVCKMAQIS